MYVFFVHCQTDMQSHDTETAHGKQAFLLPTENPSTDVNRVLKDDPSILYAMPQNSAQMQTNIAQGAGNRTSYMYNEKPIGAVSEQSHSSSPPIQYVGSKDPKNTLHKGRIYVCIIVYYFYITLFYLR